MLVLTSISQWTLNTPTLSVQTKCLRDHKLTILPQCGDVIYIVEWWVFTRGLLKMYRQVLAIYRVCATRTWTLFTH